MRTLWITASLAAVGLFVVPGAASADDRWEDHSKHQRKQWERYYDDQEDWLEERYDVEKDRLKDARERALRHAPKHERDRIKRYFRDQEKSLKREYEYREEALERQEDRHLDALKTGWPKHDGARYHQYYGPAYPAPHGPVFPPAYQAPHWERGAAVPFPQSDQPRWGVRIGPFSFGMR